MSDVLDVVAVKKVSKFYGDKRVLNDVSFCISKNEIFGLLGSNGAGKSTLTKIILGLEDKSSGEVVLFNSKKIGGVKGRVALVPQDDAFYKEFSILKNMRFFASIYGLSGKKSANRINFLLGWLNLSQFRDTRAEVLSGGYQKLLNIAISLLHDPELIFMDEPTVGLDPMMRQLFWEKIFELKKLGKTIILTTHYMDEAQGLCNRVALLKKGKLIALGKPSDLIKEYGGIKIILFKLSSQVSDVDIEMIKMMAASKGVVAKGTYLIIPFNQEDNVKKVAGVTEFLIKKGYTILSSVTKEPDLDDVFLNIVGSKINE